MSRKIKTLIISITTVLLLPVAAAAYDGGSNTFENQTKGHLTSSDSNKEQESRRSAAQEQAQNKLKEQQEQREKKRRDRCERIGNKINDKLKKLDGHKSRLDQRYSRVEQRWQKLIDRANAAGVESSGLVTALATFKTMHAQFDTDLAALRALQAATPVSCGDDGKLQSDRSQIKVARDKVLQDAAALRQFRIKTHKEVVVPLLQALATKTSSEGSNQ